MKKIITTLILAIAITTFAMAQNSTTSADAAKATPTVNAADHMKSENAANCTPEMQKECTPEMMKSCGNADASASKSCCHATGATGDNKVGSTLGKEGDKAKTVTIGMSAKKPEKDDKE